MIERDPVIRTTWPGRLAVLGLTAAVLPLAPLWAQKPEGVVPGATTTETKVEKREAKDHDAEVEIEITDEKGKKDEVRESLEELKRSLRREGGRIETEVIKSVDRALKDVRKALEDAGLTGPELSQALERTQKDLLKALEQRRQNEDLQKSFEQRTRNRREEQRERDLSRRGGIEREKNSDRPRATERDRPKAGDDEAVDQAVRLGRARAEVQALETRLHQARERLSQLQGLPRSRQAPFEFEPGRRGEEPKDAAPLVGRAFPPPNPRLERRLQELEGKFDRLLKELEGLKRERRPATKPDDDSVL